MVENTLSVNSNGSISMHCLQNPNALGAVLCVYSPFMLQALHYKKYSTASDVWSFGCLMYEIWSLGHKPFEGYTNSQVCSH